MGKTYGLCNDFVSNDRSHMAMILGRPRAINMDDCTIMTPTDCDIPGDPTQKAPAIPGLDHQPSSFTISLFIYKLAQIYHELMSEGLDKPHCKDYTKVQRLDLSIHILLGQLPSSMRMQETDLSWDLIDPTTPRKRYIMASAANTLLVALRKSWPPL